MSLSALQSSFAVIRTIGIGVVCGLADFLYKTTAQKVCMLAGMKFEEIPDPDGGPEIHSSERLDKQFSDMVIKGPAYEEFFFRGMLQPLLAQGISMSFPQLAVYAVGGIPAENLLSATVIGVGFGSIHYFCYEKGGFAVGAIGAGTGILLGIVKEKLGLIASISSHMTSNFSTGLLDKYSPTFLESDREKELRTKGM